MKALGGTRKNLHWLMFAVIFILTACVGSPVSNIASGPKPLLTHFQSLSGARIIPPLGNVPTSEKHIGQDYVSWISPTAVRGSGNYLYVVDSGRSQIYQYDRTQQGMFVFADLKGRNVTSISVASDMSMYVADSNAHTVLHFSWNGKLLQTFAHERELARPIAVIADNASAQVFVADSLYNQVIVFSGLGRLLSIIRPSQTHSIAAMARGPDGLYLVDALSRKVVVIGYDGLARYTLGADTLKNPNAIAVDHYNRVFVSDQFDNTIKIYQRGRWFATFGGSGATPGKFNRISDLWVERNFLQVVDTLNGRLQTFQVAAPEEK